VGAIFIVRVVCGDWVFGGGLGSVLWRLVGGVESMVFCVPGRCLMSCFFFCLRGRVSFRGVCFSYVILVVVVWQVEGVGG